MKATGSTRSHRTIRVRATYAKPCAAIARQASPTTSGTCGFQKKPAPTCRGCWHSSRSSAIRHNSTSRCRTVADEPQFVVTDIGSQIDLALAAELAGVDVDTIYTFNPGYNRWSTDPQGPHKLVLPVDVAQRFHHSACGGACR